MSESHTPSVTIIGAGPGGLSSAILLAGRGFKVRVLERRDRVGGRTSTIEKDGFRFDLGPTFFLYPKVLEEIFEEVGLDLWKEIEMKRLDPQYRIQFAGGGKIDASPDEAVMREQIAKLNPDDADGFERFLNENRKKLHAFLPVLQSPFSGWSDLVNSQLVGSIPHLNPHQSVDSYLKRFFKDPRVRIAFCFQSKYLGMSPYRCPSLFSILSFLEYEYGVYHPMGGCAAVSEAMARIAESMGVEIRLNEPVTGLEFEGRKVKGVKTPQGTYSSDSMVINADFARAMTSLVPNHLRRRWSDEKLSKKRFSCSTYMLYLGVDQQYDLPHHNICISEDYEQNLRDIEELHQISEQPSFYVQNACVTDPSLAPEGKSALYVLAPVTHQADSVDWKQAAGPLRSKLIQQMAEIGFDNVEGNIITETMITPDDWDQQYNIHLGATFNLAHNLTQMLHLRPRNRFEDLEGVYLVGGGTHPGSGLPVIFESAKITSDLMCQDFSVSHAGSSKKKEEADLSPVVA